MRLLLTASGRNLPRANSSPSGPPLWCGAPGQKWRGPRWPCRHLLMELALRLRRTFHHQLQCRLKNKSLTSGLVKRRNQSLRRRSHSRARFPPTMSRRRVKSGRRRPRKRIICLQKAPMVWATSRTSLASCPQTKSFSSLSHLSSPQLRTLPSVSVPCLSNSPFSHKRLKSLQMLPL